MAAIDSPEDLLYHRQADESVCSGKRQAAPTQRPLQAIEFKIKSI